MKTKVKPPRILSVKLHRDVDTDPDLSHLGEYANKPGPDDRTIDREARGDMGRHEYRYFVASMSGEDTGNPESLEVDYNRAEDYNRGEWCMLGISASAEVVISGDVVQEIRSGGLWGVESDSGADYLREVEDEQLEELRAQLLAIGCSARTIRNAFKDAERE